MTHALALGQVEDTGPRQEWLDWVVAAPSEDARRAAVLAAMDAEGNFPVQVPGRVVTLARLTRWLNAQAEPVAAGSVTPA